MGGGLTPSVRLDGATVDQPEPVLPAWKLSQREPLPTSRFATFAESVRNLAGLNRGKAPQPTDGTVMDAAGTRRYRYWTDGSLRRDHG